MALTTSGCLITDPPEFTQPDRIRPVLSNLSPSPAKIGVIALEKGTPAMINVFEKKTIHFDVSSDDRQRPVSWLLLLDFKGFNNGQFGTNGDLLGGGDIPVSELNKTSAARTPEFQLNSRTIPNCHSISVIVSHGFKTGSPDPMDQQDVDFATWWFQVGVDRTDPMYKPCEPDPISLDAGVDGSDGMSP